MMHGSSWFLARKLFSAYTTLCFKEFWVSTKIRILPPGTYVINVAWQSWMRTLSVINWTVVSQLSWHYLQRSMAGLSHWSCISCLLTCRWSGGDVRLLGTAGQWTDTVSHNPSPLSFLSSVGRELIDWVVVLHSTRHKIGHFREFPQPITWYRKN